MTSVKLMRYLLNVTFLVAPIGLKELGIQTFSVSMIYSVMINLFTVWLQVNSERRFRDGNPRISSISELTKHCYSNPVNFVYLLFKCISSITFLVVFNIYLGNEIDQILCHSIKSYQCGKFENLIRVSLNVIMAPFIFSGSLQNPKLVSIMSFICVSAALVFISYHEMFMFKSQQEESRKELLGLIGPQSKKINGMKSIFQFSSFVSLLVCMFDVNTNVLRFKHEMQRPADFFKVTAFTFFIFGSMFFGFNVLSTIAFGSNIQSPVTDNFISLSTYKDTEIFGKIDQQLFFTAKILVAVMLIANFMLYQDRLFESIDGIQEMFVPHLQGGN